MKNRLGFLLFSVAVAIGHAGGVLAGELSADEVRSALEAATPEQPADFSGQDLSRLDLSGMDLSGVNFAGANLNNTRLANAKLVGANLMGANLDGAWLIGADFSNANLRNSHVFGPVVAQGLDPSREQSPVFAGADLSGARIIAKLSQGDNTGADFSNAELGANMGNQSMGLMRFEAAGADFSDADLRSAEFDGADLTAADFTDADVMGASFDGATLKNVRGMDTAEAMAGED